MLLFSLLLQPLLIHIAPNLDATANPGMSPSGQLADAMQRYGSLFNDLSAGKVRSLNTLNTYLAKYGLTLTPLH